LNLLLDPLFNYHASRLGKLLKFAGGAKRAAQLVDLLIE
jgi:hypothetical protein